MLFGRESFRFGSFLSDIIVGYLVTPSVADPWNLSSQRGRFADRPFPTCVSP